ncbi:MAG: hypothetical protein V1744_04455 [Candidatus Altiarchaeota archaeon]
MNRLILTLLVVVLSLSACISQSPTCVAPYISVAGSCCLDENADGICDRDKPVCRRPYSLVGLSCCLDENADGICDSDRPVTTTSIMTTSTVAATTSTTRPTFRTTSTTTLLDVECMSFEDCSSSDGVQCDDDGRVVLIHYTPTSCSGGKCIYRSSRDIAAIHCYDWEQCVSGVGCVRKTDVTSTSTTLAPDILVQSQFQKILDRVIERKSEIAASMASTTTTLQPCVDPDGGKKYDIRSVNVSGYFDYNKTQVLSGSEYCWDNLKLVEFYCEKTAGVESLESVVYDCTSRCIDGRCCSSEGRTCESWRDCCSGLCQAVGMANYCIAT